ncbi:ABC transporter ATP-binding protein [Salsipaludibacter albus]|uniref:ABC transporter ATP-binding protein n=1 Tax=Salsipaludibacter albus TaxID=2849650 RepID=UPI001EE490B0
MTALARVVGLRRDFGDTRAVDGVDLDVASGEVVGLLGANGAGKTTLIRMLLGLLPPTAGHVELLGGPPSPAARRHLGYVPQGLGLYADLTVQENLAFQAAAFGVAPARLDDDLCAAVDTVVGDLSLGVRRRVAFAAALGHAPRLLVLDEPTSGVGPLGRSELWDTIHDTVDDGAGVLVTTHYMDEAEQCDRLVVLSRGRVVAAGTVAEVVGDDMVVEVVADDVAAALARLEGAGLVALPAGRRVRVIATSPTSVRAVLGPDATLEEVPATLEEAFIAAVGHDRAAA